MTKHIPYLDGWRGLAIVCLLLGHFFPVDGLNLGTVGVALFFVLSGLLMGRVLFIQKTPLLIFYQRRISRVMPSVAVYLLVIAAIFLIAGRDIVSIELISAMTFTNNYFMAEKDTMPYGHIWSLSVEEHSYIILSIAAYWCRSRAKETPLPIITLMLSATLVAIAAYSFAPMGHSAKFALRTEVASFGIIVSTYILLATSSNSMRLSLPWIAPIGLIVGVLAHWWSVPVGIRIIIGWGALALAINAMPYAPKIFLSIFESSWLRRLGIYSFSLYLWQQPYYQLVRHEGMSPWLGLSLATITSIVAYHLVEQPARLYLNNRWAAQPVVLIDEEQVKTHD